MKKKKVEGKIWVSRNRYQDGSWTFTKDGERIICFDVIANKEVMMTLEEWDEKRNILLSSGEFRLLRPRIEAYWSNRK